MDSGFAGESALERLIVFCFASELPADEVFEVAGDEHEDGEEEEGDDGGEEDAEGEGGRHWF